MLNKGIEVHYLCPYEALFKVGMYLACRLRGLGALDDRPCPYLLGAGGEEAYEAQQGIALLYELVQAAFAYAHLPEEVLLFLGGKLGDLLFYLCAYGQGACLFGGCRPVQGVYLGQVTADIVLGYIGHIYDGLGGEQEQAINVFPFVVR